MIGCNLNRQCSIEAGWLIDPPTEPFEAAAQIRLAAGLAHIATDPFNHFGRREIGAEDALC